MALQRKCNIRKRVPSILWGVHENKIPESKQPLLSFCRWQTSFLLFQVQYIGFWVGQCTEEDQTHSRTTIRGSDHPTAEVKWLPHLTTQCDMQDMATTDWQIWTLRKWSPKREDDNKSHHSAWMELSEQRASQYTSYTEAEPLDPVVVLCLLWLGNLCTICQSGFSILHSHRQDARGPFLHLCADTCLLLRGQFYFHDHFIAALFTVAKKHKP